MDEQPRIPHNRAAMVTALPNDLTLLINQAASGDALANNRLMPVVYEHLRQIARRQRRQEFGPRTLNTTALVHELYLSVFEGVEQRFESRQHFYHYAARAMRHLLIDSARRRLSGKRGGQVEHVDFNELEIAEESFAEQLIELDRVLDELERVNPRMKQVVDLRFFAGLTEIEAAQVLGVDERTVRRDWQKARALLMSAMDLPS
jgi:RNA polymerase sigma factor (TIGR02999 family)